MQVLHIYKCTFETWTWTTVSQFIKGQRIDPQKKKLCDTLINKCNEIKQRIVEAWNSIKWKVTNNMNAKVFKINFTFHCSNVKQICHIPEIVPSFIVLWNTNALATATKSKMTLTHQAIGVFYKLMCTKFETGCTKIETYPTQSNMPIFLWMGHNCHFDTFLIRGKRKFKTKHYNEYSPSMIYFLCISLFNYKALHSISHLIILSQLALSSQFTNLKNNTLFLVYRVTCFSWILINCLKLEIKIHLIKNWKFLINNFSHRMHYMAFPLYKLQKKFYQFGQNRSDNNWKACMVLSAKHICI